MKVCDMCGKKIEEKNKEDTIETLAATLEEYGDFCNECLNLILNVFYGKNVIISKKWLKELKDFYDKNKKLKK